MAERNIFVDEDGRGEPLGRFSGSTAESWPAYVLHPQSRCDAHSTKNYASRGPENPTKTNDDAYIVNRVTYTEGHWEVL
jgi:hypothetical protein